MSRCECVCTCLEQLVMSSKSLSLSGSRQPEMRLDKYYGEEGIVRDLGQRNGSIVFSNEPLVVCQSPNLSRGNSHPLTIFMCIPIFGKQGEGQAVQYSPWQHVAICT